MISALIVCLSFYRYISICLYCFVRNDNIFFDFLPLLCINLFTSNANLLCLVRPIITTHNFFYKQISFSIFSSVASPIPFTFNNSDTFEYGLLSIISSAVFSPTPVNFCRSVLLA